MILSIDMSDHYYGPDGPGQDNNHPVTEKATDIIPMDLERFMSDYNAGIRYALNPQGRIVLIEEMPSNEPIQHDSQRS